MKRDYWTLGGLAILGGAAIALSFSALRDLAILCHIPSHLAWLFPLTIDLFALIATRVWLQNRASPRAVRYARRCAAVAVTGTVVGNATHGVLVAGSIVPPWWAVAIVSAVPAVAAVAGVHLAVLAAEPATLAPIERRPAPAAPAAAPDDPDEQLGDTLPWWPPRPAVLTLAPVPMLAPDLAVHVERARELLHEHAARGERLGRGRLSELLGVTTHQARELLRVLAPELNGKAVEAP